jgi:acylphosphatase
VTIDLPSSIMGPAQVPVCHAKAGAPAVLQKIPGQVYLQMMIARKFTVTGRVQGVGFRWYVMGRARSLNIDGWVRNARDGSVEVWAEGSVLDLESLESLLRKGPPGSAVREVKKESHPATGRYAGFEISV